MTSHDRGEYGWTDGYTALVIVATNIINLPHPFNEVAEVHTASQVCTSASNIWLRLSQPKTAHTSD